MLPLVHAHRVNMLLSKQLKYRSHTLHYRPESSDVRPRTLKLGQIARIASIPTKANLHPHYR